ncbi:hypothetical protein DFP73DRAFT_560950 [Morchella snyderi]|nr:hypothetical protein DFP73DRAFT_560950 [Morchella snyderi]
MHSINVQLIITLTSFSPFFQVTHSQTLIAILVDPLVVLEPVPGGVNHKYRESDKINTPISQQDSLIRFLVFTLNARGRYIQLLPKRFRERAQLPPKLGGTKFQV